MDLYNTAKNSLPRDSSIKLIRRGNGVQIKLRNRSAMLRNLLCISIGAVLLFGTIFLLFLGEQNTQREISELDRSYNSSTFHSSGEQMEYYRRRGALEQRLSKNRRTRYHFGWRESLFFAAILVPIVFYLAIFKVGKMELLVTPDRLSITRAKKLKPAFSGNEIDYPDARFNLRAAHKHNQETKKTYFPNEILGTKYLEDENTLVINLKEEKGAVILAEFLSVPEKIWLSQFLNTWLGV